MRAVAVREFQGTPASMDVPEPTAGPGELRVRLTAAGMNPFDAKIADGIFAGHRPHVFPLILGVDGAGTVEAVGPGVDRYRPGDRLFGSFLHNPVGRGTYAEAVVVPERQALARRPDGIDPVVAASLPTAGLTGLTALDALAVPAGATLLIVGASGGVGSFAIPLAAARGVRPIAVGRVDAHPRLLRLGAAEAIDVAAADLLERLRAAAPGGFGGLLDLASDKTRFAGLAALVRPGGTAATTTFVADAATAPPGVAVLNVDMKPTSAGLERLAAELTTGRLTPTPPRVISLDEAPAALAALRAGRGDGKTVIRLADGRSS
ncbi:MAG TPA: NADP-dependent oxidoreductase [Thermoplasmata archaeon]|nr:NADP-dependent oxidoreductase [Thermoplasmata archaeon]